MVDVVDVAVQLRAAAPEVWEEFLTAMDEWAQERLDDMLGCDHEMLQRAQGMAQAAHEISRTLRQAPKIADARVQAIFSGGKHGQRRQS